ncbi:MAG: UDP-N-acetylmuramoylalanine--D-glutamate ligase [Gaiellales bacterium]|jgi:UDP-N-acetylmuramoylalanine--D-glutamate ligase|nr:UDP-N-acetylmuramoylalanine--D-glutamate ligase [Gaiellales bacterium]
MSGAVPPGEDAEVDALRVLARRLGVGQDVRVLSPWTPLPAIGPEGAGHLTGSADLLLRFSPLPVLGVTGSAGKTTTARLAEAMLLASGVAALTADDAPADNAWPTAALLARVLSARPPAWCVAELTSNHLAVTSASPRIACVTNVWPDHVDQHGSLAAYFAAKRRIVAFQGADDWVVVNAGDPGALELAGASAARILRVALDEPAVDPGAGVEAGRLAVRLDGRTLDLGPASALPPAPGSENGLLAGAAALLAGATPEGIARALAGWQGLALRREHLGVIDGSPVIGDALAATPAKAAAGLALHEPGTVVLIAGGCDDLGGGAMHAAPEERALFARAAGVAAGICAHAALFGPAGPRLAAALEAAGLASVAVHDTLTEAAADARRHAGEGRTIVFAPWFATSAAERTAVPGLLGLEPRRP